MFNYVNYYKYKLKIRGLVKKFPSFLFSSYSFGLFSSPIIVSYADFKNILYDYF